MSENTNLPLDKADVTPNTPFDAMQRVDEATGREFWSARDLVSALGYTRWEKFKNAIEKAQVACELSGEPVEYHFPRLGKMIQLGKNAKREIEDYALSRYACYLIVQNSDSSKPNVALGQTYFAVQTRRQELADAALGQVDILPEAQKRLYLRDQMTGHNKQLSEAAKDVGVETPRDFAVFQDQGYQGLYSLTSKEIHKNKELAPNEQILDFMSSDELAYNIFRASLTKQKLQQKDHPQDKDKANETHYTVGSGVREFIKNSGGTLPENLPTPDTGIRELRQAENKRLKAGPQLSMFGDDMTPVPDVVSTNSSSDAGDNADDDEVQLHKDKGLASDSSTQKVSTLPSDENSSDQTTSSTTTTTTSTNNSNTNEVQLDQNQKEF